jgi:hypothetical protein
MEELCFLCGPCREVISEMRLGAYFKNIRGLNLAVVKPTTVQVSKMPL